MVGTPFGTMGLMWTISTSQQSQWQMSGKWLTAHVAAVLFKCSPSIFHSPEQAKG